MVCLLGFFISFVDYIPWTDSLARFILFNMNEPNFENLLGQLGQEIKTLRLRAGLSQEALALAAEVDRTYVSQLERGIANPSLMILHRISIVLDRKLQIIFMDTD